MLIRQVNKRIYMVLTLALHAGRVRGRARPAIRFDPARGGEPCRQRIAFSRSVCSPVARRTGGGRRRLSAGQIPSPAPAPARLVVESPGTIEIEIRIRPTAQTDELRVVADSGTFYRSTTIGLTGADSQRLHTFEWHGFPPASTTWWAS